MRCFVSFDIPREECVKIAKIQKRFTQFASIRLLPADAIHITLEFLGELDEKDVEAVRRALAAATKRNTCFPCKTGGLCVLPGKSFFRVICLELMCKEDIMRIQKDISLEICAALGRKNPYSRDEFTAHITIGRAIKSCERTRIIEKIDLLNKSNQSIQFIVNDIHLKKSVLGPGGPEYTTIETYKLLT